MKMQMDAQLQLWHSMNKYLQFSIIKNASVIFWDFDGVIKDSVPVKGKAFKKLFADFGTEVSDKVLSHHIANGGMSRYKKIRYYYENYVGFTISDEKLLNIANRFGNLVEDEVVKSSWIDGAEEFLRSNPFNQTFLIVTGTPQREIESILKKLNMNKIFLSVHGSPKEKKDIVGKEIDINNWEKSHCIFIGDSEIDYEAAFHNKIQFVYRGLEETMPKAIKPDSVTNNFLKVF